MKLQEMRIFEKQQEIQGKKSILIYVKSTEIPPNISLCLITRLLPPISLCIIINIIDVSSRVISSYSIALFRLLSFDQYTFPQHHPQFLYVCYGSRSDNISHVVPISDKLTLERIFGAQLFFFKKLFQKCNEI